ncbi:MAG: type II toxin-antitoxin system HicA family toxin [Bacteroidetes bacterium]|nr:type II toxin-antitoxin system HicA family toxin [Bacteroidota bacterium]
MPKEYSSKEIETVLKKIGFVFISQKGSHGKFKDDKGKTVILPMNKKEIPFGTFRSILRQAGIDLNEFINKLS